MRTISTRSNDSKQMFLMQTQSKSWISDEIKSIKIIFIISKRHTIDNKVETNEITLEMTTCCKKTKNICSHTFKSSSFDFQKPINNSLSILFEWTKQFCNCSNDISMMSTNTRWDKQQSDCWKLQNKYHSFWINIKIIILLWIEFFEKITTRAKHFFKFKIFKKMFWFIEKALIVIYCHLCLYFVVLMSFIIIVCLAFCLHLSIKLSFVVSTSNRAYQFIIF